MATEAMFCSRPLTVPAPHPPPPLAVPQPRIRIASDDGTFYTPIPRQRGATSESTKPSSFWTLVLLVSGSLVDLVSSLTLTFPISFSYVDARLICLLASFTAATKTATSR
ncbi:unnamed protein product [Hydatigera taeniaeformis]|uniref:CASP-like protein n=1 Tax=Hydatigena taeniaeformis TaxID=6205 RepID=A0A0R3X570_HYDTA|nr:unnamed protein product [Hydatigera taeniaeformis]